MKEENTQETAINAERTEENHKTYDHFICSHDEKNLLYGFFRLHHIICWFYFSKFKRVCGAGTRKNSRAAKRRGKCSDAECEYVMKMNGVEIVRIHWGISERSNHWLNPGTEAITQPNRTEIKNDWPWFIKSCSFSCFVILFVLSPPPSPRCQFRLKSRFGLGTIAITSKSCHFYLCCSMQMISLNFNASDWNWFEFSLWIN